MRALTALVFVLFQNFTTIDCGPAAHNHDVSQLSDASISHRSAIRKISMAKLLRHEIERNLHNWWAVYDQKMQHYKSNRDDLMCTNHAQLVAWIQEIKPQIEKVRFGWDQKVEQLEAFKTILNDDKYKNVTGLAEVLNHFVTEQDNLAKEEGDKLTQEENEVKQEEELLKNPVCNCEMGQWSGWSDCSTTCDEGVAHRSRQIERNATNGGANCTEVKSEEKSCLIVLCPIDCQWSEWGEWSECPAVCGVSNQTRHRQVAIEDQHGGEKCPGDAIENASCDYMKLLRATVEEQHQKILQLREQLNSRPTEAPPVTSEKPQITTQEPGTSAEHTAEPTEEPTEKPTEEPEPTEKPTGEPTEVPETTAEPTEPSTLPPEPTIS